MKRWWQRGKAVEAAIRGEIFSELREEGRRPRAEEEVPWPAADPIGVGHLDAYVPSEHLAIEIKSNGEAALTAAAALQVAGYTLNHPNATKAVVIAVDSNTFESKHYPIDVGGLEAQVREIEEKVVRGCRTGEAPDRVCTHPGDSPAFLCAYVSTCFDGWSRPSPDYALLDEEAVVLAELVDDLAAKKADVKLADQAVKEQRGVLRAQLVAGEKVETESIRNLGYFEQTSGRTLSVSALEKAGHQLPAELEPFVSGGTTFERWYDVKRKTA
jgi:hypothetical protein